MQTAPAVLTSLVALDWPGSFPLTGEFTPPEFTPPLPSTQGSHVCFSVKPTLTTPFKIAPACHILCPLIFSLQPYLVIHVIINIYLAIGLIAHPGFVFFINVSPGFRTPITGQVFDKYLLKE